MCIRFRYGCWAMSVLSAWFGQLAPLNNLAFVFVFLRWLWTYQRFFLRIFLVLFVCVCLVGRRFFFPFIFVFICSSIFITRYIWALFACGDAIKTHTLLPNKWRFFSLVRSETCIVRSFVFFFFFFSFIFYFILCNQSRSRAHFLLISSVFILIFIFM